MLISIYRFLCRIAQEELVSKDLEDDSTDRLWSAYFTALILCHPRPRQYFAICICLLCMAVKMPNPFVNQPCRGINFTTPFCNFQLRARPSGMTDSANQSEIIHRWVKKASTSLCAKFSEISFR